jgi:hypothetical protein
MKKIIAPERYIRQPHDLCLFLAGGITGAPDWQTELSGLLDPTDLTVFDPRRTSFDVNNSGLSREQIEWEFRHLHIADAVSFWFPYPAKCAITLYELGAWASFSRVFNSKPIFVGVDPQFWRREDIEIQMGLMLPELKVVYSLADLAEQIKKWESI